MVEDNFEIYHLKWLKVMAGFRFISKPLLKGKFTPKKVIELIIIYKSPYGTNKKKVSQNLNF